MLAPTRLHACRAPRPPGAAGCRALGVDPSGGRSPWGVALLEREGPGSWRLALALEAPPGEALGLVARLAGGACACGVDAPLSPQPPGGLRPCERAAVRLGARLLPGWGGMAALARAGIAVAALCSEAGAVPVETHPASAARLSGLPGRLGGHAWEAVAAAVAAAAWLEGSSLEAEAGGCCLSLPLPGGWRTQLLANPYTSRSVAASSRTRKASP